MQKVNSILGAQLEFTPFTGKYSMFGKLFAAYDFYLFVGPGFINVSPTTTPGVTLPGLHQQQHGHAHAGRLHVQLQRAQVRRELRGRVPQLLHALAGAEHRAARLLAQLNPSGRDVNGDQLANNKDLSWLSTFVLTANLSFYLPTTASISQ